ncbi:hypothetical protein MNBD_NITROSPINAE04-1025 [hydrothermal vent metagenome]|uniref:General secretion pathway GspH domain-containing protein n=1 Tax=hydrothermal vent metagenome TaxID=652676 RepID=A0A3B1BFC4_9ZZZZ
MVTNRAVKTADKNEYRTGGFLNAGYTFIEAVTVIVILSVLAVWAYPLFSQNSGLGLDAAVKLVKTDIRFTQRQAMIQGATRSIVFTQGQSAYAYGVSGDAVTPYSRNLAELDSSVFIGSTITLAFNSLGEPVSITDDTPVTISSPGESVSLIVTSFTGKIINP